MVEIECSLAREIWNRRPTEVAGGPTCLMVTYVSALSLAKIDGLVGPFSNVFFQINYLVVWLPRFGRRDFRVGTWTDL